MSLTLLGAGGPLDVAPPSPSGISSLAAFWDFNDAATITLGGTFNYIAAIDDKSGNGYTMSQSVDNVRPIPSSSGGYNGRGYASFAANRSTRLGLSDMTFVGASGTKFSVAARIKAAAQSRGTIFGRDNISDPNVFFTSGESNTSAMQLFVGDAGAGDAAVGGVAFNNAWHTVIGTYQAGTIKVYVDNVLVNTNTNGPADIATHGPMMIGALNSGSPILMLTGDIEYVAVFNDVLSSGDRTTLSLYGS
jgi:hypothetical protein